MESNRHVEYLILSLVFLVCGLFLVLFPNAIYKLDNRLKRYVPDSEQYVAITRILGGVFILLAVLPLFAFFFPEAFSSHR
jgi:uncharacterized protein YjeT (DUF2065 family)